MYDGRKKKEVEGKRDRKSTRLNSSHGYISYAVFCLKKKKKKKEIARPDDSTRYPGERGTQTPERPTGENSQKHGAHPNPSSSEHQAKSVHVPQCLK